MQPAEHLLSFVPMGAPKLRVVSDAIDLDAPEAGLTQTLSAIAHELDGLAGVKRDVKSWALIGAAASAALTVAAVGGLLYALLPGAPPPAIVIQPPAVQVVLAAPSPAPAPAPAPAAAPAAELAVQGPAEELPAVSDAELAVRRAFSQLWAGRPKLALAEAEAVLAADAMNVDALAAQALALYDLRRDRAARASVKKALGLNPKHPLANVLRGTMAQVDHDVASALAHYDKYLRARPEGRLAAELTLVRQHLHPKGKP